VRPSGALGPSLVLAGVGLGVSAGERRGASDATALLVLAVVLVLLSVLVSRSTRPRSKGRLGLAVLGFSLLATAGTQRALHGLERSPFTHVVALRHEVELTGTLIDDPSGTFGVEFLLRAHEFHEPGSRGRHHGAGGRTLLVTAGARTAGELRLLEAGDVVELRGTPGPLSGRLRRFRWQHSVARFATTSLRSFAPPHSPLLRVANTARRWVTQGNERLPATERGLLAAFLLGDTRQIPRSLIEEFRGAGLSHLLVVSGANVGFVLALGGPVLRRSPLVLRFTGALLVLVVFGAMTRWEPSVLRAIAMAVFALTGMLLGRPQAGLRALLVAVSALLLADPFLLHSIGFLLSAAASGGIAFLAPSIGEMLRGPRWFRESLGVTIAAQIGVAPILIPVFGSMPLATLPANLLAVPAAGPLTIIGLLTGTVGGALRSVPILVSVLDVPLLALARYVETVARVASRLPLTVDARGAWGIVAVGSLLGAAGRLRRLRTHDGGVLRTG